MNLLECQTTRNIGNLIFSSSCTVYGNAEKLPVTESSPMQEAESVYGRTKQMAEQILADLYKNNKACKMLSLRYFNPGGIHESGLIKETTQKPQETLVPIIQEVHDGKREKLVVYGGEYNTRDGSCLRDYIHVMDLAAAHRAALEFLQKQAQECFYDVINVGTGKGTTVLEMVKACEKVAGKPINHEIGPPRFGDVEASFADCSKAKKLLNWEPQYNLEDIFRSVLS